MDAGRAEHAQLDFAIIGAQKSASTFLHRCLMGHPQIDIPSAESRTFEDPSYAAHGLSGLESLFGARRHDVRRGIKRPDHLADPAVPARMVAAAPSVRILAVLRDPVPRAVSAYFHYVRLGFLPLLNLDLAFEQILDGSMARRLPRAADVIDYGLYGRHLQRWLEHVDRSSLLVLRQQDLAVSPAASVAEALRFLDVDQTRAAALAAATDRANETSYDRRRVQLQRSRNRFMFDYTPDRYRRTPRRMSPVGFAVVSAATALDRQVLSRFDTAPSPRLRPDLEADLRERYREDATVLRSIIGRRLWAPPDDPA